MASTARIDELKKKFDENPRRYFAPLANEFRKAGDIDQAIRICEEFLPQQPGHMSGHIVYGQALYEVGRMPEARTVFETALGLDPENLIALRHLGDIARDQGDHSAARGWYDRVLDADPRNDEIQSLIAALGAETPSFAGGDLNANGQDTVIVEAVVFERAFDDTEPLGILVVPTPPAPHAAQSSTELIDGFSLDGLETTPDTTSLMPAVSPRAEGFEPSEFAPPTEPLDASPDLDSTLESGVPSFSAPSEPVASLAGLQDRHASTLDVASDAGAHDSHLLDFEMPRVTPSNLKPVEDDGGATQIIESVMEELPPAVLAGQVAIMEAAEADTPMPPPIPAPHSSEDDADEAPVPNRPFVTETMAELYLAQGFRDQALGVYEQLLAASPSDERLRGRVDSLAVAPVAADAGPTAREFFARMAARRPGPRAEAAAPPAEGDFASPQAEQTAESELEPVSDVYAVAPAIERVAAMQTPSGSIDALFGNRTPGASEDSAAAALAQAFGGSHTDEPPAIAGRPARAAAGELSLDSVFRDGPARPPRASQSFSFDQFFAEGAATSQGERASAPRTSAEMAIPGEPPAERSADDIEQFNSWLQGLKPR